MDKGQIRATPIGNGNSRSGLTYKFFITPEMGKKHIIEEDYMISELDSGEDN